jgi:transposase
MRHAIAWKAAWADRRYIAAHPARTAQDCSGGDNRNVDLTLADRVYRCVACGLVSDRERNASRAILAVGRHCLGRASEKPLRLRMGVVTIPGTDQLTSARGRRTPLGGA